MIVEPLEIPEELAKTAEVGQEEGLLVRSVEAGSPAKAAGVALGDVILSLGGRRATDEYELHKALSEEVAGKAVPLRVLRAEVAMDLEVTPGEAPVQG